MEIIVLIPTVLCLAMYFRYSVPKVFLNLYIPVFSLLPLYYYWKVSALPPIDIGDAVLVPLGLGMLLREMRRWKLTPADLCLGLFTFTAYYADHLANRPTASIFNLFQVICTAVVPYMAGKLLIEQHNARVAVVRRFVFCLFLASLVSIYEYRMSYNPFTLVWSRFFPSELFAWKTQLRWGFGRVSGPFGQSELAGIVLMFGLILAVWLAYNRLWEVRFARAPWLPFRKATIITVIIAAVLLMTQARGPWLGALLALPIALIGRSRHVLRTSLIVATVCLVVGVIGYIAFQYYLLGPASSDAQQTAQYRHQLIDNYLPIANKGGAWGWGTHFPPAAGQTSVDNEYLLVTLTQGYIGLVAFCLIAVETLVRLVLAAITAPSRSDLSFALTMLGIFVGILVTIYTVFLGNQPYQLFFLLAGWSQALSTQKVKVARPKLQQVRESHVVYYS